MARERHERERRRVFQRVAMHDTDAPVARSERDASGVSVGLEVIEAQLQVVTERLREAIDDHEMLGRIEQDACNDPEISGAAGGHRILARNRWQAALGARAQLETLYQEIAGTPSRQHAASLRILGELGMAPNPVGLTDRHPDTATFLRHNGLDVDDGITVAPTDRSARGPELEL